MVVADVSGKGVSAAMYANMARVLLREKSKNHKSPRDLLCELNNSLRREFHSDHFLTLCYVLLDLDQQVVSYASAGHEPIVLVKAGEDGHHLLKPKGYPFSNLHSEIFEMRIKQDEYRMQPGDLIFCYTDGLTDATNEKGEMFGEEALYALVMQMKALSPEEITRQIQNTMETFQGAAEQMDDITMIALKRV